VDELTGFTAVPDLGVVEVQAPAAQLKRLRASATHARLVSVENAYQSVSFGYGGSFIFIFIFTLSLGHRKKTSQLFHSERHVPGKGLLGFRQLRSDVWAGRHTSPLLLLHDVPILLHEGPEHSVVGRQRRGVELCENRDASP
jgi:hypothetical protein